VAIGVAPLIYYVLLAIEYITQYFIARVLELYLRFISGIVSLTRPLTTSRSSGVCLSPPRLAGRIWAHSSSARSLAWCSALLVAGGSHSSTSANSYESAAIHR
jgi:hypothetical protein